MCFVFSEQESPEVTAAVQLVKEKYAASEEQVGGAVGGVGLDRRGEQEWEGRSRSGRGGAGVGGVEQEWEGRSRRGRGGAGVGGAEQEGEGWRRGG